MIDIILFLENCSTATLKSKIGLICLNIKKRSNQPINGSYNV